MSSSRHLGKLYGSSSFDDPESLTSGRLHAFRSTIDGRCTARIKANDWNGRMARVGRIGTASVLIERSTVFCRVALASTCNETRDVRELRFNNPQRLSRRRLNNVRCSVNRRRERCIKTHFPNITVSGCTRTAVYFVHAVESASRFVVIARLIRVTTVPTRDVRLLIKELKMENLIDVYEYDSKGYFAGTTIAQVDDVTREIISMPDNCTTIKPECKEDYFYRFDGEKWIEEKIPTTPEECVSMVVAHESRTPHDYTLKKLFVALTAGSKTHRLARGKDLSWSVEAIPEKTPEEVKAEASAQVRAQRDALLAETDHLVMPDYPLTDEQCEAVKAYRQELRDVPQQDGFPLEVVWPKKPEV